MAGLLRFLFQPEGQGVTNPTASIIGTTHQVSIAPPVSK